MRNLREILASQKDDSLVLARDFYAYVKDSKNVPHRIVVQTALDRTAVVYPPGRVDAKTLVRLELVEVDEAEVKWLPRNPRELQQMRARAVGRQRGRLAQDEAAV